MSWNVREKLLENLDALFKSRGDFDFEVFVVDNSSEDGTADTVCKNFPQVNLIANDENIGFGAANNLAMKKASGKYLLFLNPDMRVFEDTLDNAVKYFARNNQAAAIGPRLEDDYGEIVPHIRRFPKLFDQLMIVLKVPHFFPAVLNKYLMRDFDYSHESEVPSIRGSFFAIRREVLESIGAWDERFFVWFEEVDLCRRIQQAGLKIFYTPSVRAVDLVGQSFKLLKRSASQKYFRDSMLRYFQKWHPAWQYPVLRLAWFFGLLLAVVGEKLSLLRLRI